MTVSTSAAEAGKPAPTGNVKQPATEQPAQPAAGEDAAASPQERQVEVAAARLRVTLDRRLNRQTPAAIAALAAEEL